MIKGSCSTAATKDAVFGDGVYFTKLGPDTKKEDISYNNWRKFIIYECNYII